MKIDHLGIACKDIQLAKKQYLKLGYVITKELITDFTSNLDYIFMKNGSLAIELIAKHDLKHKSDIDNIVSQEKMIGNNMYHICYVSTDLISDIKNFKSQGYKLIRPPSKAIACDNKRVSFLIHIDFGIIELIEE